MIVTIIPAAGRSKRMVSPTSKQFMALDNMPVLAHTLKAFEQSKKVDQVIVVGNAKDLSYCRNHLFKKYDFKKVTHLIQGGRRRQDSVFKGLQALPPDTEYVVIHDGARPLVTPELIDKAIAEVKRSSAVVVGIPLKDTIKVATQDQVVEYTLDRPRLWAIQTPQVFKTEILVRAHRQARADKFWGTDDASLVERMGNPVKVIMGSEENVKITTPIDMVTARAILMGRRG